jgi:apolipoprotein N-acyltransferase
MTLSHLSGRWWNDETRRYPWSLAAGVLWGCSFPTPGLAGLAWVAPGMLLFSGMGLPWASAFRVGYLGGLAGALIWLRWLLHIPDAAGSVAGWIALSGYVGLSPGFWLAGAGWMLGRSGSAAGVGGWRHSVEGYAGIPWGRRALIPLMLAAWWVGLEMIRSRWMGGFPWNPLGVSQWRQVPLLQLARWTGAYGISFLVCWASVALVGACLAVVLRPRERGSWLAEARIPLFAVLICLGTGFFRVMDRRRMDAEQPASEVRLALIQPAIPQTVLWDEGAWAESFAVVERLTQAALTTAPEVVIWPEGSFGLVQTNYLAMTERLGAAGVRWIFCETDLVGEGASRRAYNAAFLSGNDGRVTEIYRKRRLVPFGEFVPLVRWLPFMRHLTPIGDGFASGEEPVVFGWARREGEGEVRAAPIICFEDVFAHGIRSHLDGGGVDFLLELTNDAWFGESGAQWQHLANAVFRAVENEVPVVRCTNNGVTCWVDELGAVREVLGGSGAAVYREGFLTVGIPVGNGRAGGTWYSRHGDVFGWSCLAWAVAGMVRGMVRGRGWRWI